MSESAQSQVVLDKCRQMRRVAAGNFTARASWHSAFYFWTRRDCLCVTGVYLHTVLIDNN